MRNPPRQSVSVGREAAMRPRRGIVAAALALALFVVAVPFAGSTDEQKRLVIGFNMAVSLNAPNATGTFVAAGAVNDSGPATATVTLTPIGNDAAMEKGTHTLTGGLGTITIRFRGRIRPLSSPHQFGKGSFKIVGGTGAYAGLRGKGKFILAADFTIGTLIGTYEGRAKPSH